MSDSGGTVDYRAVLEQIRDGRMPCFYCGRVHEFKPSSNVQKYGSWADPDDGHPYRKIGVEQFVGRVLAPRSGR